MAIPYKAGQISSDSHSWDVCHASHAEHLSSLCFLLTLASVPIVKSAYHLPIAMQQQCTMVLQGTLSESGATANTPPAAAA